MHSVVRGAAGTFPIPALSPWPPATCLPGHAAGTLGNPTCLEEARGQGNVLWGQAEDRRLLLSCPMKGWTLLSSWDPSLTPTDGGWSLLTLGVQPPSQRRWLLSPWGSSLNPARE